MYYHNRIMPAALYCAYFRILCMYYDTYVYRYDESVSQSVAFDQGRVHTGAFDTLLHYKSLYLNQLFNGKLPYRCVVTKECFLSARKQNTFRLLRISVE